MNVKKLKELLDGFDDDLEVRVYADHGQHAMGAFQVYEHGIDTKEDMAELDETSDIKVLIIEG